jgi:hypothetical protein
MPPPLVNRFATPFTAGLFLVTAVSGVALFFRVGMRYFFDMHVWLSVLLLLPFGLHVWKNWSLLLGYLRRGRLALALAISGLLAAGVIAPIALNGGIGGDPGEMAFDLLFYSKLTLVAPLVHRSANDVVAGLRSKGYTVASIDSSLREIASSSGSDPPDVLADIVGMSRSEK